MTEKIKISLLVSAPMRTHYSIWNLTYKLCWTSLHLRKPSLFNPDELANRSRIQSFCNSTRPLTGQLCSIWSVWGPFTLRSLTWHKTRSDLPHPSHCCHTRNDLIELRNTTFCFIQQRNDVKEDHFLLSAYETRSCVRWTWYNSWQSPPYGCHSLNSYNICLCQTTEFIQCINNKTMATFHPATRLSAQCDAVWRLSKHSTECTDWTELVIKPTAELHTVRTWLCFGVTMFTVKCVESCC